VTRRRRELLKTEGKPMVTRCDGLRMASAVGTLIATTITAANFGGTNCATQTMIPSEIER
jgi:hypothetical protein